MLALTLVLGGMLMYTEIPHEQMPRAVNDDPVHYNDNGDRIDYNPYTTYLHDAQNKSV